jgi:hypothetical protein
MNSSSLNKEYLAFRPLYVSAFTGKQGIDSVKLLTLDGDVVKHGLLDWKVKSVEEGGAVVR